MARRLEVLIKRVVREGRPVVEASCGRCPWCCQRDAGREREVWGRVKAHLRTHREAA